MGRGSRDKPSEPAVIRPAADAWSRRRRGGAQDGPGEPELTGWCVPADELQELVDFLASPGILPIIRELAAAGRGGCRDLRAAIGSSLDEETLRSALDRLAAFGLVYVTYTGHTPTRTSCVLTASGHDLLAPLAGFATWYRHNHDQLPADPTDP
jgi:DNA-binding HxlR family transcriptional regulator